MESTKLLKHIEIGTLTAFFSLVFLSSTQASDQMAVGGLLGPSFISSTTQFTIGAEFEYKLTSPWATGAALTYYNVGVPGSNYNSSFTTLTGQGWYLFSDDLQGFRAGAQLGLGFSSTNIPGASGSTNVILGPSAGYDYLFSNQVSVGGEGTFFLNTASGSSVLIQLLAAVKYWF